MGCAASTHAGSAPDNLQAQQLQSSNSPPVATASSAVVKGQPPTDQQQSDGSDAGGESFFWSDFEVARSDVGPSKRAHPGKRETVQAGSSTKAFVYADFKVFQKEDQLEEDIIRKFYTNKNFQWGDFKGAGDTNPFLFSLSYGHQPQKEAVEIIEWDGETHYMTEDDVEAARKLDHVHAARKEFGIRHYTIRTLLGHAARVKCIAVSPNETHFVSSSSKDDRITMWDIATGELRLVFQGHEDTIISARFSHDGRYLATTSRDRTLMIWDTVIGKQLFILEHAKIVICCAFSPDGKLIVSGCQDRACRVWNTKRGKELASFAEHEGIITSVAFSPNNEYVASASSDWMLILWKALTAERIATLTAHTGIVLSCSFSADGNSIVSSDERLLHVWDVSDVSNPSTRLSLPVEEVGPGKDSPVAVADNLAKGDVKEGKRRTWTVASYAPAAFPDFVLAACSDRRVYVIDPRDGSEVLSFFTKAAVYCLSASRTNIMFGDAYGNVYVAEMS